jgi:hypothetical protein
MEKIVKTADDLAELVMQEARKSAACAGTTGVSIGRMDDPDMPFTWYVTHAHNSTDPCIDHIQAIEVRLQAIYDLAPA